MAILPPEYKMGTSLSSYQKQHLQQHGSFSETILQGRINLGNNFLTLIKNHHILTTPNSRDMAIGLETILINIMDMFVAITSNRPYRKALSPFRALEIIRSIMLPHYSTEFKYFVLYLKKTLYPRKRESGE
jgi:HD-GYP domain-containing protein (c-di-GMP phosphodiesterase class II)